MLKELSSYERLILEELLLVWVGDKASELPLFDDKTRADRFHNWVTELYKCQFLPFNEQVELKLMS